MSDMPATQEWLEHRLMCAIASDANYLAEAMYDEMSARIAKLEAELAALKARCETCPICSPPVPTPWPTDEAERGTP